MSITICHASIDENKRAKGGTAGDQTSKEVCTRKWYDNNWNIALRYKDWSVASKVAEIAVKLANSNLVGYDQNQRNTLYTQLKKHNWNVDAYIASGIKTETDCSAFVYACYCCLVPAMRSDSNAPTTSTMKSKYAGYGFTVESSKDFTETDVNLIPGDILVKEGHHTVMAVTIGSKIADYLSSNSKTTTTTTEKKTETKSTVKVDPAQKKDSIYNGTFKATANLNLRAGASTSKTVITVLPKDTEFKCYGYYSVSNSKVWLYVQAVLNGTEYTGFVSSDYVHKI